MGYKVDIKGLNNMYTDIQKQVEEWVESIDEVAKKVNGIILSDSIRGKGAENIKSYFQTVHTAIIQSLLKILESHVQNCLMYKNDYQMNIDSDENGLIRDDELFDIRKRLASIRSETWGVERNIRNALTSVSDIFYTNLRSTDEMDDVYDITNRDIMNLESDISRLENQHLNNDFKETQKMITALEALIRDQRSKDKSYKTQYTPQKLANSKLYANLFNAYGELEESQWARSEELERACEYERARAEDLGLVTLSSREGEGWWQAISSVVTMVLGIAAIISTWGSAAPIAIPGMLAGTCTTAYGASNLFEAGQNIYYGGIGDDYTAAINPIRDTVFMGNQKAYDLWGGISTTAAGLIVPVGQAYAGAKMSGLTGRAVYGAVGKTFVKELSYDIAGDVIGSGTSSFVFDLTGNVNLSRLAGLSAGMMTSGKSLNHVDNATSGTVKGLNHTDSFTSTSKKLDRFGETSKAVDNVKGTDWYNYFRETYGKQNVCWENCNPSEVASAWQGNYPYFGVDTYINRTLNDGDVIWVGEPYPTGYSTTFESIEGLKNDAHNVFEGLQVKPYYENGMSYAEYRKKLTPYRVNTKINVADGFATNNPQFGKGGLAQMFDPNFDYNVATGILTKLDSQSIELTNTQVSLEDYFKMMNSMK